MKSNLDSILISSALAGLCFLVILSGCATYGPVQNQVFEVQSSDGFSEDLQEAISLQNVEPEFDEESRAIAQPVVTQQPYGHELIGIESYVEERQEQLANKEVLAGTSDATASKGSKVITDINHGQKQSKIRQGKRADRKFRKIKRLATNSDLADTFAMISLILGIASVVFFWLPIIGLLLSIAAVGLGAWAYFLETRDTQFAIVGGALGGIGLLLWVIMFLAYRTPLFFF